MTTKEGRSSVVTQQPKVLLDITLSCMKTITDSKFTTNLGI